MLLAAALTCAAAANASSFTFTYIANANFEGINNAGTLAGTAGGNAVTLSGGTYTTVGVPAVYGGQSTYNPIGVAINNVGFVLGDFSVGLDHSTPSTYGFLTDGSTTSVIVPPGSIFGYTQVFGLNDFGAVVGRYSTSSGTYGFLEAGGVYADIVVPGQNNVRANGINDSGTIVGSYSNGSGSHGFIDQSGVFTLLDVPGGSYTSAEAINNLGEIVGDYYDSGGVERGFTYQNGVFSTFSQTGLDAVLGVNDSGQIVGIYSNPGILQVNTFVATPTGATPEPATAGTALTGMLALLFGAARLTRRSRRTSVLPQ
jgi:probable HAF family extracellular repeat protein